MIPEEISARLLARLRDDLGVTGIDAATPLFSSGILDSINLLELVVSIEEEFDVTLPALDISVERLDTVGQMTQYLSGVAGPLTE